MIENLDPTHGVVIGGEYRRGGAGLFDVEDPATRQVIASVADGDARDATAAVDAAAAAFDGWRALAPRVRSEILRTAHTLMLRENGGRLVADRPY